MKPTLTDILLTTLDWHYMDVRFWENYQSSRSTTIVAVKRDFCVLAFHAGYLNSEIGNFLHMREATVEEHLKEIKKEYADYIIKD